MSRFARIVDSVSQVVVLHDLHFQRMVDRSLPHQAVVVEDEADDHVVNEKRRRFDGKDEENVGTLARIFQRAVRARIEALHPEKVERAGDQPQVSPHAVVTFLAHNRPEILVDQNDDRHQDDTDRQQDRDGSRPTVTLPCHLTVPADLHVLGEQGDEAAERIQHKEDK